MKLKQELELGSIFQEDPNLNHLPDERNVLPKLDQSLAYAYGEIIDEFDEPENNKFLKNRFIHKTEPPPEDK